MRYIVGPPIGHDYSELSRRRHAMTPERWKHARHVFHEAMECEPDRRPAFLTDACSGDEALRSEVEALLLAHEKAGDFLQNPLLNSDMQPADLHLRSGTRLGLYEVSALIGAGGMGEVYRARDTRLGRDVAIKILPSAFTG